MRRLFCVVVGAKARAFSVEIDVSSKSVEDLTKAIVATQTYYDFVPASPMRLFLAKDPNGRWLDEPRAKAVTLNQLEAFTRLHPSFLLENGKYFGNSFRPTPGEIHVLVVPPPGRDDAFADQRARKKTKTQTHFTEGDMQTIASNLHIDTWELGSHIPLRIRHIEPDFPEWFYVRKETLEIFELVNDHMSRELRTVFVESPGVGKSMLVVLFAFHMALRQRKRVVLLRRRSGVGFTLLYMDAEKQHYWHDVRVGVDDLGKLDNQDFELCLDGFEIDDIKRHFQYLARYSLLATSAPYPMKNDDIAVLRRCLVPFWSRSDLIKIGVWFEWTACEIRERYYYSGGNLRQFLTGNVVTRDLVRNAARTVSPHDALRLNTRYRLQSTEHEHWLVMAGSKRHSHITDPFLNYRNCNEWVRVITSEYALRQLGNIRMPSFCRELWSNGRLLGDEGLMDMAFKNYVHSMARDGQKLTLHVRPYDRESDPSMHSVVEFRANSYRNDGQCAEECEAILQHLAGVDYWHPFNPCVSTIDSVAKLPMSRDQDIMCMIQMATSGSHNIDSAALNKYPQLLPRGACFIVLVPDKATNDKIRFLPAEPQTALPVYIAYIATWHS